MALKIAERITLTPEKRAELLSSVVSHQVSRPLKRQDPRVREARAASPIATGNDHGLDADQFRLIADWHHAAILEMTYLAEFKACPKYIAKNLGISQTEAKLALERLFDLGLLVEENGRVRKVADHIKTTDKTKTGPALKRKQKQIRELAIESIERDPIETRTMTTVTMCIDPSLLEEARRRIDEFNRSLSEFLTPGERKQVYVMEIGLFPLQKKSGDEA
jgi:uncharacterized protein (TIGR02147 family)